MSPKVLVIGIDAMSPVITRLLMEEGRLPNFAGLNRSVLATTIPPETPVAWSAAATGTNPGKYGIFDFINRNPKTCIPMLCLAVEKPGLIKSEYRSAMRGIPFWELLNQADIDTTVIRWPVTFPAKKIKGRMLSGLGTVDIRGSLNSYSFYTSDKSSLEGEGSEKVIVIDPSKETVDTHIRGPLVRKRGELVSIKAPCRISISGRDVRLTVDGKEYPIRQGRWSEMIPAKFKVLPFHELHGIFNVYLESVSPEFKMYLSSVQLDPVNQAQDITYPKEYGAELVERFGLFYTLGMPEETKAVTENRLSVDAFVEQVFAIEKERERHFMFELDRFSEGLLAFVFDAGDRLNHIAWENTEAEGKVRIASPIERYYVEKDTMLGNVLSHIDEDTKLIVLSDHGFTNFTTQVNLNSWLVQNGYMHPVVEINEENNRFFKFADWSRTKAYSLGFTSVFVNLAGREGKGIVPANERDALVDEIAAKLETWENGGERVCSNVYKGREIYFGEHTASAPDIVVGFAPGFRMSWKSAVGALDKEILFPNDGKWRGDHLVDRSHVPGVLFTNFDINGDSPSITDIAPTILKLFGVNAPEYIDGESLI